MTLTLIPPRVAFVDENGLLSREGYLFLQQLFNRVGGSNSQTVTEISDELSMLTTSVVPPILSEPFIDFDAIPVTSQQKDIEPSIDYQAQISKLEKTVAELQMLISALVDPIAFLSTKQNTIVVNTASGSWGGNVAGQSLAAALASSGLIIDTTTP